MKKGLFIVFMGVDGVGKSTIIRSVSNELITFYNKDFYFSEHLRPKVLKEPGDVVGHKKNDYGNSPIDKKTDNFFMSIIRILYYTLDYTLGNIKYFKKYRSKNGLIIMDRYYYDFFVNPERCRVKLPHFIIRFFYFFVPKPDIVFYLKADPTVILNRKKELSYDEIVYLNNKYENLLKEFRFIYCIDANNSIDAICKSILEIVKKYREKNNG